MTKFEIKSKAVRIGEVILRPRFEWNQLILQLKQKLRRYKQDLENEKSFVAPNGWEYRTGHIGQVYLWPKNFSSPK